MPIQFGDRILSFLPGDPDHVLIEVRNEHELYPDVQRVNMRTGLSETILGIVVLADLGPSRDRRRGHAIQPAGSVAQHRARWPGLSRSVSWGSFSRQTS